MWSFTGHCGFEATRFQVRGLAPLTAHVRRETRHPPAPFVRRWCRMFINELSSIGTFLGPFSVSSAASRQGQEAPRARAVCATCLQARLPPPAGLCAPWGPGGEGPALTPARRLHRPPPRLRTAPEALLARPVPAHATGSPVPTATPSSHAQGRTRTRAPSRGSRCADHARVPWAAIPRPLKGHARVQAAW